MKILIKVTKEVYKASMMCGTDPESSIASNCAIAFAAKKIDERVVVGIDALMWDRQYNVSLPGIAKRMIERFDNLASTPEERLSLPEFSFEVDFPDELVDRIGIDQVHKILSSSKTLEMVPEL